MFVPVWEGERIGGKPADFLRRSQMAAFAAV